jgi:hypothetical protein
VLHAFAGAEGIGQPAEIAGGSLYEQDFEIVMMFEVHLRRSNDHQIVLMLNVGEFALEVSLSVVVNEADGAGHALSAEHLGMAEQLFAGHFRDRVRAIGELPTCDHVVKVIEQIGGERDAEAGEFWAGRHEGNLGGLAKETKVAKVREIGEEYGGTLAATEGSFCVLCDLCG